MQTNLTLITNTVIIHFLAGSLGEIHFCLKALLSASHIFTVNLAHDHQCWESAHYEKLLLSCSVL